MNILYIFIYFIYENLCWEGLVTPFSKKEFSMTVGFRNLAHQLERYKKKHNLHQDFSTSQLVSRISSINTGLPCHHLKQPFKKLENP